MTRPAPLSHHPLPARSDSFSDLSCNSHGRTNRRPIPKHCRPCHRSHRDSFPLQTIPRGLRPDGCPILFFRSSRGAWSALHCPRDKSAHPFPEPPFPTRLPSAGACGPSARTRPRPLTRPARRDSSRVPGCRCSDRADVASRRRARSPTTGSSSRAARGLRSA